MRRQGYDVLIIGGGIAGLTAAWHASLYGLSAALLESSGLFGGQVATVTKVEGYPGLGMASGADLAASMLHSARGDGLEVVPEKAQGISGHAGRFKVATPTLNLQGRSVVVASGARLRRLELPAWESFVGRGISQCASCDGPLFRNQDVAVVGGGDAALQEAALLSPLCRSVTLIVRGDLRARKKYIDRLKSCSNVKFMWESTVAGLLGSSTLAGVQVRNNDTGAISDLACTGLFPFIGAIPNTEVLADMATMHESGAVMTNETFATSQKGIYAVGAVRQGFSGELSSAAGEAAAAVKIIAAALG